MKTKVLKQALFFTFLSICLFVSTTAFGQKVNLSGNWKLNEGKSQLGEGRFRMAPATVNITQDETTLNMERTSKGQNGQDFTSKEKYTLDGKECENTGFMNSVKKSTVTFSSDNKTLTITSTTTFEREGNKMEIKQVENFKVSDDGNTLTLDASSTSQRSERKQTLVYEKAK